MAVLPVLSGEASVRELAEVWGIVWIGNIAGALGFSALIAVFAPQFGIADTGSFDEIATALTDHTWWVVLVSAILAGLLMGLLT